MAGIDAIDRKIKRLVSLEVYHRAEAKHAQDEMRRDPERKAKYLRVIAKNEKKVEKILPKIRRLREQRARMAGSR